MGPLKAADERRRSLSLTDLSARLLAFRGALAVPLVPQEIAYGGWKCFPVRAAPRSPPDTLALSGVFIATQQFVP